MDTYSYSLFYNDVYDMIISLPDSPVEYNMLTTFLDVCNSLVVSEKKKNE